MKPLRMRRSPAQEALALTVVCPNCRVAIGDRCRVGVVKNGETAMYPTTIACAYRLRIAEKTNKETER